MHKIRFLKTISLAIIVSCLLSSCQWIKSASTPYFMFTNFKVPEGTPKFQAGYRDGCSSVLYARGSVFYRNRYGFRYDNKMINDQEYNFGHQRGYSWCFQHSIQGNTGTRGSITKIIDDYGYDSTFNRSTIKDFGGLMGDKGMWKMGYNINDTLSSFQKTADGSNLSNNLLWTGANSSGLFTFR
jgi:hypothetical protein